MNAAHRLSRLVLRWQAVACLMAIAMTAGACATHQGATPRPFPGAAITPARIPQPPGPLAGPSALVIQTALGLRGIQYRWGGADLEGFDCSGFTQYVYARHGVTLPREVRDQYREGRPIRTRDIQPGDLLFFSTTAPGASHVAIAVGDGQFVHAPASTGVVRIERLDSSYWSRRFLGARRLD